MSTLVSSIRTNTVTLASSSAGPFLVGFRLFADDDLAVYVNGLPVTNFNLQATFLDGTSDDGQITFDTSLLSGDVIIIDSALDPTRQTDYLNTDPRLVEKFNIEIGRLWSVTADLKRDVARSAKSFDVSNPMFSDENRVFSIGPDGISLGPTVEFLSGTQTSIIDAERFSDDASAAAVLSQAWASSPINQEVETGLFSALHYASLADAARTEAEGAAAVAADLALGSAPVLQEISQLSWANNKAMYATGPQAFNTYDITAAFRTFAAASDSAQQRTSLELGSASVLDAASNADLDNLDPDAVAPRSAISQYVQSVIAATPTFASDAEYQDVRSLRSQNTIEQNTTGHLIYVVIRPNSLSGGFELRVSPDNINWISVNRSGAQELYIQSAIIMPGHYYRYTGPFATWVELRRPSP